RTKEPLSVGTTLKLAFSLNDGSSLLLGGGTVVWIREHDPARAGAIPGMGVRFDHLSPESQSSLDRIIAAKAKKEREVGAAAGDVAEHADTGPGFPRPALGDLDGATPASALDERSTDSLGRAARSPAAPTTSPSPMPAAMPPGASDSWGG